MDACKTEQTKYHGKTVIFQKATSLTDNLKLIHLHRETQACLSSQYVSEVD